ncbi:hypothetical protein [Streptomyces sp. NBC_00183]|uniref:hypothetical protein n=1 Tax=Streptomyces sp. NBC_00183 TaxID=2903633 RepID=UPI00225515F2|nr:hypothetical protein [Streptomyces sp. NBC_00183]MCX5287053.1 hypothetical protein [Streptomyces sp. NBC_00183]
MLSRTTVSWWVERLVKVPQAHEGLSSRAPTHGRDEATIAQQIKMYAYNSQNSTPDVQAQVKAANTHWLTRPPGSHPRRNSGPWLTLHHP